MALETIIKPGTPKSLEGNGAAIANNALAPANDGTFGVFADSPGYPDAKFVLSNVIFSVAPTEGGLLSLYAQPLDIKGTADAEVPEATRPTVFIGNFVVNNVTTPQNMELIAQDVPWLAWYFIHNNSTGQTVSAGWALDATPCTLAPAP